MLLSAANYILNEITSNDDIIKGINKGVNGYNYKKIEFNQIKNNSINYIIPVIEEMRRILIEDENEKIKNNYVCLIKNINDY